MSRGTREGRTVDYSGVRGRDVIDGPRGRPERESARSRLVTTGPRSRSTGGFGTGPTLYYLVTDDSVDNLTQDDASTILVAD